jgi:hypothetical protein
MSACSPKWIAEVVASYELDVNASTMINKLLKNPAAVPHFTFADGLLRYKKRVWVGNVQSLQQKIIAALHNSPVGGTLVFLSLFESLSNIFLGPV